MVPKIKTPKRKNIQNISKAQQSKISEQMVFDTVDVWFYKNNPFTPLYK